jgi:hypothetical protein
MLDKLRERMFEIQFESHAAAIPTKMHFLLATFSTRSLECFSADVVRMTMGQSCRARIAMQKTF